MRQSIIDDRYERKMLHPWTQELYGYSDFYNFGYWQEHTRDQREACENLVDKLMSYVPRREGLIVDVACGMGATTRHLLHYYQPSQVIGINISRQQLQRSQMNAPGCTFTMMDATQLAFPDQSIDNMICVEAAFHFNTRASFLAEAFRVLKPGGHVVLSDILTYSWAARVNFRTPMHNYVADLDQYVATYRDIGFDEVQVLDATTECWRRFLANARRFRQQKVHAKEMSRGAALGISFRQRVAAAGLHYYLLASALKP